MVLIQEAEGCGCDEYECTTTTTTTPASTTTTERPFDPEVDCPAKGTLVKWKGASVSKVMFYSETGAMLKVNFFNDAADFDVVTGEV